MFQSGSKKMSSAQLYSIKFVNILINSMNAQVTLRLVLPMGDILYKLHLARLRILLIPCLEAIKAPVKRETQLILLVLQEADPEKEPMLTRGNSRCTRVNMI